MDFGGLKQVVAIGSRRPVALQENVIHPVEDSTAVEIVVPIIMELLRPRSVVDFGCNIGVWLEGFERRGVKDILGIDNGQVWAERLKVSHERFVDFDLDEVADLDLQRRFDLALCLECAEHLEPDTAPHLVRALCNFAPNVVFSAAIPGQTGYGHKNEQYPEYWMRLFLEHGFEMYDCFRRRVWTNPKVEFWYKQNMYLFSKEPNSFASPEPKWDGSVFIAPELLEIYVKKCNRENPGTAQSYPRIRWLVRSIRHFISERGATS